MIDPLGPEMDLTDRRRAPPAGRSSFLQNQAPEYFHLNDLRSLYRKILPFLHRLIQAMISTLILCIAVWEPTWRYHTMMALLMTAMALPVCKPT